MIPQFVKPYRKGNKNDPNDAAAICEAVTRPSMRFVSIKSAAQQDIQALHRVREQLLKSRTALVNQVLNARSFGRQSRRALYFLSIHEGGD